MPKHMLASRPEASWNLPASLMPLVEVAYNLWWTWDAEAQRLFADLDSARWEVSGRNPVALLRKLPPRRLERLATDRDVLRRVRRVATRLRAYLSERTWYRQQHGTTRRPQVAYFSMEYALHESLPIFAGGLGVLAGDHFKSASDLGLPLVGVGILWNRGYVRQTLDRAGNQVASYHRLKPEYLPLIEVREPATHRPLRIEVPMGSDTVLARAWWVDVGRVPVYLLDTNLPQNQPRHRRLTDRLYIGTRDERIRQELLLGIGGWRLLQTLNLPITVCHLNEGHAVFCAVERVAQALPQMGGDVEAARRRVAATTVFTTHTPVPEGNEAFAPKLAQRYFEHYCARTGLPWETLLAWARVDAADADEDFGMTPLALRLADRRNGVAKLHGEVSRGMWQAVWPKRTRARVPIGSVTNGVHLRTWMHPRMAELLDEYLAANWSSRQDQARVWQAVDKIPPARLWELHCELKAELLAFVDEHLRKRCERLSLKPPRKTVARPGLEPDVLTLGFARRFATYKRAALIFSDVKRLQRLVNRPHRPVQLVFAGKAHPADTEGQELVAQVARHGASRRFQGRVVFLEDYSMDVARFMVAGVDVWLNNPRRPREASGTSGMKPALHGGLNLSILDGWWPEACEDGRNGWAIGKGQDNTGTRADDLRDARALYQRLERDVVPLYYKRDRQDLPAEWIRCMKHALTTIPHMFNSHRMVKEYLKGYYLPALRTR